MLPTEPWIAIRTDIYEDTQRELWAALNNPDRSFIDNLAQKLFIIMADEESFLKIECDSLKNDLDDTGNENEDLEEQIHDVDLEKCVLENRLSTKDWEYRQILDDKNDEIRSLEEKIEVLERKLDQSGYDKQVE